MIVFVNNKSDGFADTVYYWNFDFEIRYKKGSEMPADYLSISFKEISAISVLDMNWAHEQEKDNLSNLIKESLDKKLTNEFPMPEWFKKAEFITNMAIVKNNIIWINKNNKLLLYVPFKLRQKLLYAANGDLLTRHDGVKNTSNEWTMTFSNIHKNALSFKQPNTTNFLK